MTHRIAITGGAGFIGLSLAKYLSTKFYVEILDTKSPVKDLGDRVSYTYCDVRDYGQLVKKLEQVDMVLHTAIIQIPSINEHKLTGYEVNIVGTQNVCNAVERNSRVKGMILTGTWHTIGERNLQGVIDEEFGFRPDKVEERAKLYAISKIGQEAITRYYDEMSSKTYGIIRMGTVLGEGMPSETAASIFIQKGIGGERITPFKHSMYRPMLYVDLGDICRAYEIFVTKILDGDFAEDEGSLEHIVNVYYPRAVTIYDLAQMIRKSIIECSGGKVRPEINILDKGVPLLFAETDKNEIKLDIEKARKLLGLNDLRSPEESVMDLVKPHFK